MGYLFALIAFVIAFFVVGMSLGASILAAVFTVIIYFAVSIIVFFCLLGSRKTQTA